MSATSGKQRLRGTRLITDQELIQLLDDGLSQVQIAELKRLAPSTISRRVKRIRRKAAAGAQEKARKAKETIEKALIPLGKDWQCVAGNPGAIFDTTISTRVGILQKQLETEAYATELQQPTLHDRIMKTCDSLDKATVQVIQAAEALRFRHSLEKLEKDIVEVIDELDDGIKREILAKFNEKRAFHTADSLLK